jgi:hypothetical protein
MSAPRIIWSPPREPQHIPKWTPPPWGIIIPSLMWGGIVSLLLL